MISYAWIVAFSASISVVFVEGTLFSSIRSAGPKLWRDWATCPMCVGVWVGAIAQIANYSGNIWYFGMDAWAISKATLAVLGTGAISGSAALLYHRIVVWLDFVTIREETEIELLCKEIQDKNKDVY